MKQISQHNRKALRQDSMVVRGPRTLIWVWLVCALACVTFATPGTLQAQKSGKSEERQEFERCLCRRRGRRDLRLLYSQTKAPSTESKKGASS